MKYLYAVALTLLVGTSISGCAALGKVNQFLTSQKNPVLQQAAIAGLDVAIAKVGKADPKALAAKVKKVALMIQADAANPTATVEQLEAVLNTEISKVSANPEEAAAFMMLAQGLELALNTYIATNPGGPVASTTLVSIQGLCAAVVMATNFYGV